MERRKKLNLSVKPLISLSQRLISEDTVVKPGVEYTLVPCAHSAGVEGHFCITIASQHGVKLTQITSGTEPTESEREEMDFHRSRAATCYICKKAVVTEYYDFAEGRVHAHGECEKKYYEQTSEKCVHCKKGIVPLQSYIPGVNGRMHEKCFLAVSKRGGGV